MRKERVENPDEIAELIRMAERLARAHPCGIQMESWWLLPWLETLAQRPFAIVLREGNDILACGFFERREASLALRGLIKKRILTFLSQGPTDFSDVLACPDVKPGDVARTFAEALKGVPKVDEIRLEQFPGSSAFASPLSDAFGVKLQDWVRVYFADLRVGYEALWRGAGRNARRDIHKKERKLRENFEVRYDVLKEADEALISEMVSLNAKRRERRSPFIGKRADFTSRMIRESQAKGRLLIFTMRADSSLISYRLGFLRDGIFWDWNTSYDPGLFELSPGKIHLAHAIRWCADAGLAEFNFMRGDEDYKRIWSTGYTMNRALALPLPTFRMRMVGAWARKPPRMPQA
ncbi:MAG: GNAT family N-acetyltransferase [candidate division WOR-3 bacterium]